VGALKKLTSEPVRFNGKSRNYGQSGKSLGDIKKELKMPETDDWAGKDRFHNSIEAAYRAAKGT
jgi:hypothetical protein